MSNAEPVTVECNGTLRRIPMENPYMAVERLKSIIRARFNIDYPFNLTYEGAELSDKDTVYDLGLKSNHPVRVRRCSIDDSQHSTTSNLPTDVFLSYEQTNRDTVRALKGQIEDETYSCWWDIEQISGNIDRFSPMIEQAIQKSSIFVACITSRYARSIKCQQELSCAKQNKKRIILLLMEQIHWPPNEIRNLVSGLPYIEFYNTTPTASSTPWSSEKFNELLAQLREFIPQI